MDNNTSDTWTSFYVVNKTRTPKLKAMFNTSFSDYDDMTKAMTGLRADLIIQVATYG
jgi:hypothetical protein